MVGWSLLYLLTPIIVTVICSTTLMNVSRGFDAGVCLVCWVFVGVNR